MTIQYENGAVGYFDVPDSIFISKSGKPVDPADVQSGDWVRILVNQAIIQPGYMIESVKEISVENSGHDISSIIKGTLGAVNTLQNEISIQNAYKLTNIGWSDYSEIKNLSVDNNDIEYYYNGN
ncbi:MAG: hypothetical protein IJ736_09325, partial [Firmicutes bacterium]|nr:hypothetical protein [Bacillota bacterium]